MEIWSTVVRYDADESWAEMLLLMMLADWPSRVWKARSP